MALRDDLSSMMDTIRDDVCDEFAGLRFNAVQVQVRTWSGQEKGRGEWTATTTTLAPVPRVRATQPQEQTEGGRRTGGEFRIDKISRVTYSAADLFPTGLTATQELVYLIDGVEFEPLERPKEGYLGWSVLVRRRSR